MGRYTGPKLRKIRRFGEDFALFTDRSTAAKFVKSQRKQPPGVHGGARSFRKYTGYGLQLREKQKAKIFYHVSESQMRRYYQMASNRAGSASDNFMQILESRLDNVVYRSGWANSHPQARQWLSHGQFSINGRKVTVPSILVKAGDKIELTAKSSKLKETIGAYAAANKPVGWLKVDSAKFTIEVKDLPARTEIDLPVDESLIIEFYSR
ncbi:30S ribosomal protein S4 [Patescibacteria group bacterium]|nr:30S ribosomal protein S4 [Patescibacteria group bacterium]